MNTATITVAFLNPPKPGKKNAVVKDTTDKMWLLPIPDMPKYSVGGTYEITYETFEFNKTTFSSIKSGKPIGSSTPHAEVSGNVPRPPARWTEDPKKSKQMRFFLCSKCGMEKSP